jgi:hypothetical protein
MASKKTKDWWVGQTHKYSREVGELRDLLEKETAERIRYRNESAFSHKMAEATTARMDRCADMMEALVTALAQHEGHDELVKDARVYLNILIHGRETVTRFQDYAGWSVPPAPKNPPRM